MTDIFDEVGEDLRRDKLNRLWKRYGVLIIALAKAADGDHAATAESLLAFATTAPKGYAALARFRAASEHQAAGETDNALAAFDQLATDGSIPAEMRDLAAIRAAMIAVDREDLAAIKARLAAYDTDISPWRVSARELIALAAVKAAAWDDARAMLDKLKADPNAPQDVASRTGILSGIVRAAVGEPDKPANPGS